MKAHHPGICQEYYLIHNLMLVAFIKRLSWHSKSAQAGL